MFPPPLKGRHYPSCSSCNVFNYEKWLNDKIIQPSSKSQLQMGLKKSPILHTCKNMKIGGKNIKLILNAIKKFKI
jgi:arsenate reductase-like glutaredoxin family protein